MDMHYSLAEMHRTTARLVGNKLRQAGCWYSQASSLAWLDCKVRIRKAYPFKQRLCLPVPEVL